MSGQGGSGGGTGFLFGNVDKQGRLEEDYLSDEAKENLDHIGTKVTEKHHELSEIRQYKPGDEENNDLSINPQIRQQQQQQQQQQQLLEKQQQQKNEDDLYEESDGELDFDENERSQLAQRALQNASKLSKSKSNDDGDDDENYDDDDENYDADDDDDGDKTKQRSTQQRQQQANNTQSSPLNTSKSTSALQNGQPSNQKPSPSTASASASKQQPQTISPLKATKYEESARQLQQRLLEDARTGSSRLTITKATASAVSQRESHELDQEDDPILFSNLFARPQKRINFSRPVRHTYGVKSNTIDLPPPCADDAEQLLRPKSPVEVDPINHALEADEKNRQLLFPSAPEIRPRVIEPIPSDDYKLASAPLLKASDSNINNRSDDNILQKSPNSENLEPAPFQLMAWENDIVWNDDDDDNDQSSNWYSEQLEKQHDPNKNPAVNENDDDEDDDDDDDEFEDPVEFNPNLAINEKEKLNEDKKQPEDDDDDDDMEWEDGDLPVSSSLDSGAKKSTQTSIPEVNSQGQSSQPQSQSIEIDASNKPAQHENNKEDKEDKEPPKNTNQNVIVPSSEPKKTSFLLTDPEARPKPSEEGSEIVKKVIAPNRDLASGMWVKGIIWSSDSECSFHDSETDVEEIEVKKRLCRLILDPNDPNMIFENISNNDISLEDTPQEFESEKPKDELGLNKDMLNSLIHSSGSQLMQSLQGDRFNLSNDVYYASNISQKLDRGPSVRRLQDAPPAIKIQTAPSFISHTELLSYRRPKLSGDKLPKNMTLIPLRRKRVKGGHAQVAGQIPKKKAELRCSEKDAFRVSIFEYTMERQPCLLPIPGMASRIRTCARKDSAAEVQRADQTSAGTINADIIYMGPDEPPPLAAGNIESTDKPLSVVESSLYVAPCAKHAVAETDFLLVRQGKNMYVREIDSLTSIGLTEPKVEVMTPNTDRYKKYGRERIYLWVMREFQRMKKEIDKYEKKKKVRDSDYESAKQIRNPPHLEKEEVFKKFNRRRTYPETALNRALKDFGKFQNGKYVQNEEIVSQYGSKEQEMMRVLTPIETSSFESMEAGWTQILERGVLAFTYPSQQGNILAAADPERSGLESGPAVGKYIKSLLLKTPWYRSQNIISAHRSQRKDLLIALSLARNVNDLKDGGEVMEAKLKTLTPTDMIHVLTTAFKCNSKKIPQGLEEKRSLIRELCQKKGKGAPSPEVSDYPTVIRNVLKKNRDAGYSKGAAIAAMGTSMEGGTFLGIPLPIQRKALEDGDVSELPAEENDFVPDVNAKKYVAEHENTQLHRQQKKDENSQKRLVKKGRPLSTSQTNKHGDGNLDGKYNHGGPSEKQSGKSGGTSGDGNVIKNGQSKNDDSESGRKKNKSKLVRLKRTFKYKENGVEKIVTEYITDPDEIKKVRREKERKAELEKNRMGNQLSTGGVGGGGGGGIGGGGTGGGLKIAIDMKKLGQAGKKRGGGSSVERPKSSKPKSSDGKGDSGKDNGEGKQKKNADKKSGQVGKIKINTKQLHKDKEQAALKRKRAQYSDDIDYRAKKAPKTSRKKRNGTVELNGILEQIENTVRGTEGFIDPSVKSSLKIARLRNGESPPVGVTATKLANPNGIALDFTVAVDTKKVPKYKEIVKKQMFLNLIRLNCKQMKYKNASEFLDDVKLIVTNARDFNSTPEAHWVVQHAELLHEVAVEEVSKHADEIKMAEDMVAMEKLETKGNGTGSKGKSKSKSGKSKSSAGDKKKKKTITETITIPDNDDVQEVPPTSMTEGAGLTDDIYNMNPTSPDTIDPNVSGSMINDVLHVDN